MPTSTHSTSTLDNDNMTTPTSSLPPPLPSRDRGVTFTAQGATSASTSSLLNNNPPPTHHSSPLDVYYSHLQKHVRVVKRKSPRYLPMPALGDYETTLANGTKSTNWVEYLKAWIDYIIQSAASDRIDDQLEPFSYDIMKSGCDRLYRLGMPLMAPMQNMVGIYEWQNVPLTGGLFSAYLFLWWMDLLAVCGCLGLALFVITVRLESFAALGIEAMDIQGDDEPSEDEPDDNKAKQQKNWRKRLGRASDLFTLSYTGCEASGKLAPESKSVNEWRTDITTNYGPTAQLLVLDIVDKLERLKNLVTWKRPAKTRALLVLLVAGAIGLFYIPYGYITKSLFFWLGIEFFVLQYMRTFYPRYRRLFNVIDWVLWGVPNDAQYAMEVIRLSRHEPYKGKHKPVISSPVTAPVQSSSSSSTSLLSFESIDHQSTSDTLSLPPRRHGSHQSLTGDRSVSLPELPLTSDGSNDSDENKSIDSGEGKKKYGKAISTTTTLATMMASTAVGQFKQLIDDKLDKNGGDKKSIPVLKDKNCPSYGCMYQGSIPGRLVILEDGFQFRSSRMTGAKVFVDYAWQDLVSVRKTKSMDALIFHTNGLDIHLSDGQVLSFENVIKRDECFTHLVSSGEHW
ncbi:hypothetical protein BC941DRAFT_440709 [Chlamydoabsidia padenii]|nr:hypothetical protein BC941DRAFT_440709 [Chlamydoabsidia padenii]